MNHTNPVLNDFSLMSICGQILYRYNLLLTDSVKTLILYMDVIDYIQLIVTSQVKDLEVELETTKQKSKENLQQSILIERERVTQMQWDMEELRRKTFEMELKLKSKCEQVIYHFTCHAHLKIIFPHQLL